jgi:hypothetical protein
MDSSNKTKVKRMPYSKTYRQESRLEWEEAEKLLRDGNRKNRIIFGAVVIGVLLTAASLVYCVSLITPLVSSLIGAE